MSGNGVNASGSFAADASGTVYTVAGNARFRTATDLVVGGFDFGAGVKPFVAGRRFVTSAAELTHTMNVFGLNFPVGGAADSRISSGRAAVRPQATWRSARSRDRGRTGR